MELPIKRPRYDILFYDSAGYWDDLENVKSLVRFSLYDMYSHNLIPEIS